MKQLLKPIFAFACLTVLASSPLLAGGQKEVVIALKTGDFELVETDVSEMAVGEARTIETENGKMIDILRTTDGAEVYIDGELLEMNAGSDGERHELHRIEKHVEIICDDDENCNKEVFVVALDEGEQFDLTGTKGDTVIFHREIELSCTDSEEGTSCDQAVLVNADGNIDLEELHHLQEGEKGHKFIVIKKEILTED
jgi:hypothetical protein